jgi:Domain of unknown function (DUF4145)
MRGMKETVTHNKKQGEEHELPCLYCHVGTKHAVLQSVDVDGEDPRWDYYNTNSYQIVQCKGCESISFRKVHTDSENYEYDEESQGSYYPETVELYPSRIAGRRKLDKMHFLPLTVQRIYGETYFALINKQPILAGIGIRALVEAVCKEENALGRDLEKRIDDLVLKGILTQAGADILHGTRLMGNMAAHQVKPHTDEELAVAMDVVENLLYNVYLLPKAASVLPKRAAKAAGGTTAASPSTLPASATAKVSKKGGKV